MRLKRGLRILCTKYVSKNKNRPSPEYFKMYLILDFYGQKGTDQRNKHRDCVIQNKIRTFTVRHKLNIENLLFTSNNKIL